MKMAEERSKINPVVSQIEIGQDVTIAKGSLTGIIATVCSLPSRDRVIYLFLSWFHEKSFYLRKRPYNLKLLTKKTHNNRII